MVAGAIRGGADIFSRYVGEAVSTFARGDVRGALVVEETNIAGEFTTGQPAAVVSRNMQGAIRASFFEDFYNRTYLIPSALDFGSVAIATARTFYVFNAWLKPITVTQVLSQNAVGTSVNGPPVGRTLKPLQTLDYTAFATEDGPANFSAEYSFGFDTGELLPLILFGERARLLPFGPNWRDSYTIALDYKTEVLESRSGREQRRALRQTPRKTVEYLASALGRELKAFNRHMNVWQNRVIIQPEEPSFAVVTTLAPAGQTVFEVETIPAWLVVGAQVFLQGSQGTAITKVSAVVGLTVGLEGPSEFDMPPGSRIMLALYGRLTGELTSTRETNTIAETRIVFEVNPGTESALPLRPVEFELDGRPILTRKPNWSGAPTLTYLHPRESVDYDVGRTRVFTPIDFSSRTYSYLFTGLAQRDVRDIVELFHRCRGRAGEFYYPSWEDDLPFSFTLNEGTRGMEFLEQTYFDSYDGDTVHRAVMLLFKDGSMIFNSIAEEPVFSDGRAIMTFTQDWPRDIEPGEPVMTCWMYASRFATDKLTVEWLTREVARIRTSFQTLEDLPYDL